MIRRSDSGFTLIDLLLSIAIFAILFALVIVNFRSAQTKTTNQAFNQRLLELFQRAANYAQTGRGINRCANNNIKDCTVATQSTDCVNSAPCDTTPPLGGWGVHYVALNNPSGQPASFRLYGDRADAECARGYVGTCSNNATTCYSNDDCGWGNTCNFGSFPICVYLCYANPNRRFDYYYGQGGFNSTESRRCVGRCGQTVSSGVGLNCESNGFQDDVVDPSPPGSVTVPSNVFIGVYVVTQNSSKLVTNVADINFSLTTGKANLGIDGGDVTVRDPTYAGYSSRGLLTKVCTATASGGPFHKILIYASGLVTDAGDNYATC